MQANGIPDHATGQFPGRGNPNAISPQSYTFRIPRQPQYSATVTPVTNETLFGVALNGVPFDPGTAEYWHGDRSWTEEGIVNGRHLLGIDQSNAHVQPNGAYHYHGLPAPLAGEALTHVGYAADGFRIYAARSGGPASSWRLRRGQRAGGPGGAHDGTYTQDFEYVPGSGDLDDCNGMTVEGTYAYVLTENFPFVPRCWHGAPDDSFRKHMRGGPGGRRPPPRGMPPPRHHR